MRSGDRPAIDPWEVLPPAELVATVAVAPAPDIPLAAIRDLLAPVHDDEGRIVDWVLTVTDFERRDALGAFTTWRRSWRPQWPIGPVTNLASLLDEVREIDHHLSRHLDAVLTDVIAAGPGAVTVPVALAGAIVAELDTVRLALSVDERSGAGIVDDMPSRSRATGLARTWAPVRSDVVLAATASTVVLLRPDRGLVLLHDGPQFIAFDDVTGADLRADVATFVNARGASLRLTQEQARPVGWLVPRSLRWHVRSVPLVAVWTLVFEGVRSALLAAVAAGVDVEITGAVNVV